ncbi:MAG: DNA repair protein RecN [Bacteroidota bacterium]
MLQKLNIKNYAIIKQVDIEFHKNFNIITGETGAGKSILMGALGLILGDRADAKSIMTDEDKCVIEAQYFIKSYKLKPYFSANELDYDDVCIVRREITSNGKSRAFINDTPVTLNQLKDLGSLLIDIVSQHETLALNDNAFQLSVIDAIADHEDVLNNYKNNFQQYKKAEKYLAELMEREAKSKQDEDYFQFILNELVEANLQENEQQELELQLSILSNAEQIKEATYNAYAGLDVAEQNIIDQLRAIKNTITPVAKHNILIVDLAQRVEQSIVELKDIAAELDGISEKTNADPKELERVEERLQLLFALQKKHRVANNAELLALQQKLENDLLQIGSLQHEIEIKQTELTLLKNSLTNSAQTISSKRASVKTQVEQKVKLLLAQVAMPDASLQINQTVLATEQMNINGIDKIEFMFSANKGSAFQPISKVASGGELSRLMLCIKSLISEKVSLPSIVFDEIDTGISGEAALKVSQVLQKHASKHQIIAITHLPQIAAKADAHFNVYKQNIGNKTVSNIKLLNKSEQINEIAVMLSGNNPTDQVVLAAKELMMSN